MAKRKLILALGLSFILGTLAAGNEIGFWPLLGLFILASAVLIRVSVKAGSFFETLGKLKGVVALSAACLFVGFFYFHLFLNLRSQGISIPFDQEVVFRGMVSREPQAREDYQILELSLRETYQGKVKVFAGRFPEFHYGEELEVRGEVQASRFKNDWPIVFNPEIKVLKTGEGFWLKEKLLGFKKVLLRKFGLFFESDQAALISGLTFGERGNFSAELKEDMARSGVTHIVALSGYNIAILALAIEKAFSYFLSRRKRFYLMLAIIFIFVLMVGGEASVVRAAIMGALALLAAHVGRPHDIMHLVVLTATAMILIDPTISAFNIGFQLSFLSLLGIMLVEPALRRIFNFKPSKQESFLLWKENALTTISAQLAVLPVLILNFDYFSPTSILANILILFAVPFTMFLGFLVAGLGLISVFLGFLAAKLVSILLFYEIAVIKLFSWVSVPLFEVQSPILVYTISYGLLLVLILYSRKYEKVR